MKVLDWRTLIAGVAAAAAIWYGSVEPLRFEIELRRLHIDATRATNLRDEYKAQVLAVQTFERITRRGEQFPTDVRLAMLEGSTARIAGRPEAAVAALERALRYDRRPELLLSLAFAEDGLGRRDAAVRHLAAAIRFTPEMVRRVDDPAIVREAIAAIRGGRNVPLCCAADFDADGSLELLRTDSQPIRTEPATVSIQLPEGWTPMFAWQRASTVVMLAREGAEGPVSLWRLSQGKATQSPDTLPLLGADWHVAGVIARDRSGDSAALLLFNEITRDAKVWRFESAGFAGEEGAPSLVLGNATPRLLADFDADGDADALCRLTTGEDYILLLDGLSPVRHAPLWPSSFQREPVAAADLSGDAQPDILWFDFESRRLILWVMNGSAIRSIEYWPR